MKVRSYTLMLAIVAAAVTTATAASLCTVTAAGAATSASKLLLPTSDPFYKYTGSLAKIKPGTVLRTRTVNVTEFKGVSTATQVLYRTTTELGKPAVTVATLLKPELPVNTGLVSYQTAYDALGPKCDPSYAFRGGDPTDNSGGNDEEADIISLYLAKGDPVVVPDYEGERFDWTASQQAGYATLDGIRAAEHVLGLTQKTTPVGMVGYSGGSIATEFAAELSTKYAPDLDLVGAADGGVPVDFAHNLKYINGTTAYAGVIPAAMVGLGRAFGVNVEPYLSAYGRRITKEVASECINSFAGDYPHLTYQKMLKPRDKDIFKIKPLVKIMNHLIMGRTGTPKIPMMFGVGNYDGTGDTLMIDDDVKQLAYEYCERGTKVTFTEYPKLDHTEAAVPFEAQALAWMTLRLTDVPAIGESCALIGKGNSLKPLPTP
jgi:Secretory lipase